MTTKATMTENISPHRHRLSLRSLLRIAGKGVSVMREGKEGENISRACRSSFFTGVEKVVSF
jgi:hypothetical protein